MCFNFSTFRKLSKGLKQKQHWCLWLGVVKHVHCCICNHISQCCHRVLQSTYAPLQQREKLNHWISALTKTFQTQKKNYKPYFPPRIWAWWWHHYAAVRTSLCGPGSHAEPSQCGPWQLHPSGPNSSPPDQNDRHRTQVCVQKQLRLSQSLLFQEITLKTLRLFINFLNRMSGSVTLHFHTA